MILFEPPYVKMEYVEKFKCLNLIWTGKSTSQQWIFSQMEIMKIYQSYEINKSIVDTSKQVAISKKDSDWTAQKITPKVIEMGLEYIAFVVSKDMYTKLGVLNYTEQVKDNLTINYFDNFIEAEKWITSL